MTHPEWVRVQWPERYIVKKFFALIPIILDFNGWIDCSSCVLLRLDGESYEVKIKDLLADMIDEEYVEY